MVALFLTCKSTQSKTVDENAQVVKNYAENMPSYFVNSLGDTIKTVIKSVEKWQAELSPAQYYVLREKGTERSFTSDLLNEKREGIFACAACGLPLFRSEEKFESGTGWPSFWKTADDRHIIKDTDHLLDYPRTELMCAKCGGHLGHVFDDGPQPTGLRYCINGVSLSFVKSNN
ncbi:MAG TPA: peptide-methionine (R)-S-oxide reductase MsrB [Saprospiraceae bacterium]|nr:peptide-methionine (R)-S-oxide reductase MsrB [Saprospiraceae bacterium]HPN68754.1 peptide-methionine (R)-S-oxide reductase MsrB [Saprospiraceae bacterium]